MSPALKEPITNKMLYLLNDPAYVQRLLTRRQLKQLADDSQDICTVEETRCHGYFMEGYGAYQHGYLQGTLQWMRAECNTDGASAYHSTVCSSVEGHIASGMGDATRDRGKYVRLWDIPFLLRDSVESMCRKAGIRVLHTPAERHAEAA